ncbi:YecA family protein [Mesorhizobium sp. M4A.F.Ca.ET.050.02.1.1]|nr:YecA family protein [Mesorhizobium sp. M4A.F.Ca.ET.050.02.1.1]
MADYAMSFEKLGHWLDKRRQSATLRRPRASSLSMLDGAVAAVVAGPVSMPSEEWGCPLLGLNPDTFDHDTEEFSAIAATLMRHNAIGEMLSTRPQSFEPLFLRMADGGLDVRPWCMAFYTVMKLRLLAWSRLLSPNTIEHTLLLPILFHGVDDDGRPLRVPLSSLAGRNAWSDIPAVVEAMRQFWMPTRFKSGR